VDFLLPYDTVLAMWRKCIEAAYEPSAIYGRYAHQQRHTFRNRPWYPMDLRRLAPHNVRRGIGIFARLFWRLGVRSSYRGDFWRMAARTLGRGRFEEFVQSAVVSHHLIEFARQCLAGMPEPSFYAPSRTLAPVPAAEA
jgi:hypothetical protein